MIKAMTQAIGGVLTFIIVAVVVVGIGVGIWAAAVQIDTKLSKPAGNAQVTRDTNNGTNQEASSGIFAQLIGEIQSDQAKMQTDVQIGNPTAAALVNSDCITVVSQYNADTKTDTLGPNLPAGDPTSYNPTTTCAIPTK